MNKDPIIPIVLCGGIGSRLWPLSRESFPKQFISFINSEKSLLQSTVLRTRKIENIDDPILICNESHRFIVAEQMREISIKPHSILLEPAGKNTAPAITLAALKSLEIYKDPTLLVLSSDHIFKNEESFIKFISYGITYSDLGSLVTFGVTPNHPHTGYGYIEAQNKLDTINVKGEKIIRFIEKPKSDLAKILISDKKYTWNSGIFLFKSRSILSEIETFSPKILEICKSSKIENANDLDFERIDKKIFSSCPNISIDVSVMEKTSKGIVLPLDAGWSDIGDWNSVWENSKKDSLGNVAQGKFILKDTKNSYLRSENKLIVGIGLNNLIIVDADDALLICDKNSTQEVKNTLKTLLDKGYKEAKESKKVYRPWGYYISTIEDKTWKVKLIFVKPKESLSLQKHKYRSEHWVVVGGKAKVTINQEEFEISENESTYIPIGAKHRLSNPGDSPLFLVEVQSGPFICEEDIIRYIDKYGRDQEDNF